MLFSMMSTICGAYGTSFVKFQPVERNSEEKIQQKYDWVQRWQTDMDS